ncbi:MAG: hypothetical protein ACRDH8_00920 [Actinomycetota bacterium]
MADLAAPGVRALEETLGPAGHPVTIHMLEILPADVGRLSRPSPEEVSFPG